MKHSWNHIIFGFIPFFFRLVQIDLRSGVLHAFFSRRREKKAPFYNQSFFVISPVRSNPFPQFFTQSFAVDFGDHLRSRIICGLGIICGWGSFAVLYRTRIVTYSRHGVVNNVLGLSNALICITGPLTAALSVIDLARIIYLIYLAGFLQP